MTAKYILTALLLILAGYGQLMPQSSWKAGQYTYFNGKAKPTITLYSKHKIDSLWTFTGFFLVNDRWGEGFIGINYRLFDWMQVELELGIEAYEKFYRAAGVFFIKKNGFFVSGVYENGGSVYWYELKANYNIRNYYLGGYAARFYGYGPRIDYRFTGTDIYLWTATLYEWETKTYGFMLGFSSDFY